jgi:ABC-type enterochelin transport system ATPase subunit
VVEKILEVPSIEMSQNKITAVLGPTNTGKTYLAIETMLSFDSGMIGFPLRLLQCSAIVLGSVPKSDY